MSSSSDLAVATTKYQLSLPLALHSISPSLSALHATRACTLHQEASGIFRSTHCAKCGSYYFSGDGPSYLSRRKKKGKQPRGVTSVPKIFQRTCHSCGFSANSTTDYVEPSLLSHATIAQPSTSAQPPGASGAATPTPIPPPLTKIPQESESLIRADVIINATTPKNGAPASLQTPSKQSSHLKTNRTKKPSTLQEMLARDRRREETSKAQKKTNDNQGGLAAFLQGL
ncbi:hypothetical protein HYDPIDRAFT_105257 [Hydnomerulius pinastri MD-312]|nr:hypothetical protein HYDPIDRAFT_105257 [Hydnomerulius pinastri MD-312]